MRDTESLDGANYLQLDIFSKYTDTQHLYTVGHFYR